LEEITRTMGLDFLRFAGMLDNINVCLSRAQRGIPTVV
jgi:hypothetical protein